MDDPAIDNITLYTSRWCPHSITVETFLKRKGIAFERISIDHDKESRDRLIRLNNGYASVPTLVFADGTKLTEPSLGQLRRKLSLPQGPGLARRIRQILTRNSDSA